MRRINLDLPEGIDWRRGALDYVSAEREKWGTETYDRYLLSKPLTPLPAGDGAWQAQLAENLYCLHNLTNALALLQLPGGSAILDVACGSGWLAEMLARFGYAAYGFDVSAEMIELARRRFREQAGVRHLASRLEELLFVHDIERDPLPKHLRGRFDAIFLESCLHHFLDPVAALENLAEGLSQGGVMVILEGENRRGGLKREYRRVMEEFQTLERPLARSDLEEALDLAGLTHRRFLGRLNGFVDPEDPRLGLLAATVARDAEAANFAVCARSRDALRRLLPHLPP